MTKIQTIKRPFVWLKRFRKRCGYGVHSPFAFDFITGVIYEKSYYYAYHDLARRAGVKREYREKKINRLLFRLVNRIQPETIVDAGVQTSASEYLKAAKASASYLYVADNQTVPSLPEEGFIDFLFLHHHKNPQYVRTIFYHCIKHSRKQSVFVIKGIHYSAEMKKLWREMADDERTGITFDLYDLGIVFFDKTKIKQHYIVNF